MKIELTLQVDLADLARLRHSPLLTGQTGDNTSISSKSSISTTGENIYFDTPDRVLRQHGCVLQVTRKRRYWQQTLTICRATAAGGYRCEQWTSQIDGPTPLPPPRLAAMTHDKTIRRVLNRPYLWQQLLPVFSSTIAQTSWQLRTASETKIAVALRQGQIACASARQQISELQLQSDDPSALFALALTLQQTCGFRICHADTVSLGYGMLSGAAVPHARKMAALTLPAKADAAQSLRLIAGNCLEQICGNEAGVLNGDDPEHLHQMRVGLRRLRVAMEMFSTLAAPDQALCDDIVWLAGELGSARNWEVLAHDTLPALAGHYPAATPHTSRHTADARQLQEVQLAALHMAARHRRHAVDIVASARYTRLLLRIGRWSQPPHLPASAASARKTGRRNPGATPMAELAPSLLANYHHKLRQRGKTLRNDDPVSSHRLRIAAKKLRYVSDFLHSLAGTPSKPGLADALNKLLDKLGAINDARCADELLLQLARQDPRIEAGCTLARGYLAAQVRHELAQNQQYWKQLRRQLPGRKK